MILSQEKSIRDYIYSYWARLSTHLEKAAEALDFQQSWQAYKIAISDDKAWYKTTGFRKNSKFPARLAARACHTLADWLAFENEHKGQYETFKNNTHYLNIFIYKYFMA